MTFCIFIYFFLIRLVIYLQFFSQRMLIELTALKNQKMNLNPFNLI